MKKWIFTILILIIILCAVSLLSLFTGAADMSITKIFRALAGGEGSLAYSVLFQIRLPRILMGLAIGGALSLAGALLQGMFRNPLVEPYTLGLSGGALLGVCFNMLLGLNKSLGFMSLPVAGFAGSFIVILIIYSLSMKKGIIRINGLLLTGVMISYVSSSVIMLIMAVASMEELQGIVFWMMGSLEESDPTMINLALAVSLCGLAASYFYCHRLNALALGEEEAVHIGVNVEGTKRVLFIIASVLTGMSVSVAGLIGFVGLLIPHLLRMFIGGDHRILLIASYISGAAFLMFCDMIARTVISPSELPVGVITGILGGTFFVYAMSKRSVQWTK